MDTYDSPEKRGAPAAQQAHPQNGNLNTAQILDSSVAVNADRSELVERQGEVSVFRSFNGRDVTYQVVYANQRWCFPLEYSAKCKAERVWRHGGAQR